MDFFPTCWALGLRCLVNLRWRPRMVWGQDTWHYEVRQRRSSRHWFQRFGFIFTPTPGKMIPIWQPHRFFKWIGEKPPENDHEICLVFFWRNGSYPRGHHLRQVDIDPWKPWQKPQVDGHHYGCPCWHLVSSASFVWPDLDHATWVKFRTYFSMLRNSNASQRQQKTIAADAGNVFGVFEALLDFYCQTLCILWLIHRLHTANIAWAFQVGRPIFRGELLGLGRVI